MFKPICDVERGTENALRRPKVLEDGLDDLMLCAIK